jgi:hypothetical protein
MAYSFTKNARCEANSSRAAMFRRNRRRIRGNCGQFLWSSEPADAFSVPIPEPRWQIGLMRLHCRPRFDFPPNLRSYFQMVINAAHVPAIVALIAGVLILIMPRLLNFIVAIYLIFVGLVGMGLLRWLHL